METDRLLAAAEASCRERFRPDDPDSSEARGSFRRAALRVTLRVAAASAFALAGVAAVSVGANGALAALGGGHTTPRTLPSTAPRGRWGSAFDAGRCELHHEKLFRGYLQPGFDALLSEDAAVR